jgi:hypothetical protein
MANLQSSTIDGSLVINGSSNIQQIFEKYKLVTSGASGTIQVDILDQAVVYYSGNSTANFVINVRGNSTTTFDSTLAVGQTATIAVLITNGTTARYPTALSIDGVNQNVRLLPGANPSGNAGAIDVYSFNIIKTAANTFTVLGSQTKYTTLSAIGGTITLSGGYQYHTFTSVGPSTLTVYW